MLSPIDELLFNIQVALLGAIHPSLRAVQIELDEKQKKLAIPRAVKFCEFSSCSGLLRLRQGLKIPDQKTL